jgi:hypothetical protein
MALVLKALAREGSGYDTVGVVKDGEYVGEEAFCEEFEFYSLDDDGIEAELAAEYTGHGLNASLVDDDEVDLDAYRERFDGQ